MIITQYPVDLTGRSPDNLVSNEEQLLLNTGNTPYRVVVFDNGGFYADSLKVYDKDYKLLVPNTDYIATYVYTDASNRVGLSIMGAVVILNATLTNEVRLSGQMVGGDYAFSLTAREDTIAYLESLGSGVVPVWGGYEGVTPQWQPGELIGERWQLSTYTEMNMELEWIAQALKTGDPEAETGFYAAMRALRDNFLGQLDSRLNDHIQNTQDPHDVTAAQIGLDQVANYPVATQAQAEAGTDNASYLTPQRWWQAMAKLAGVPLTNHIGDTNNPHQLTAVQVSTYPMANIDTLYNSKLLKTATAVNALNLMNGSTPVAFTDGYTDMRKNLTAGMFGYDVATSNRVGIGTYNYETILLSDGNWVSIQSLFNLYAPQRSTAFYYIGQMNTQANALSQISVTFANISAYPVGTIVVYRISQLQWIGTGNGAMQYNFPATHACIRTASGWVQL